MSHQELLHLDVVVLAEKLKESKSTAQRQLVVQLSLNLEFIGLMPEHLYQHSLLFIKQIVRVYNLVRKVSLFFVVLEFSDLDQEVADVLDEETHVHEGCVSRIFL